MKTSLDSFITRWKTAELAGDIEALDEILTAGRQRLAPERTA